MPNDAEDFDDVGITLAMPVVRVQKNAPLPPPAQNQPNDRVANSSPMQPTTEPQPTAAVQPEPRPAFASSNAQPKPVNAAIPTRPVSESVPAVEATIVLPFPVYTSPERPPAIIYDAAPLPVHATVDIAPPLYTTIPTLRPIVSDTPSITWQYCEIQLHAGVHDEQQTLTHYPFYLQLTISYLAPAGVLTERVTEETDDQSRPKYLWGKLLGLLGMAGWDMVTEDRGAVQDRKLVQLRAYFKRQVTIDKPINEPNIIHFL